MDEEMVENRWFDRVTPWLLALNSILEVVKYLLGKDASFDMIGVLLVAAYLWWRQNAVIATLEGGSDGHFQD